jgi:hypothetical protein
MLILLWLTTLSFMKIVGRGDGNTIDTCKYLAFFIFIVMTEKRLRKQVFGALQADLVVSNLIILQSVFMLLQNYNFIIAAVGVSLTKNSDH